MFRKYINDNIITKTPCLVDISLGIVTITSLEGCTHRLADVGNRVHTRNDSDEDVRGFACHQAIAWKALPWSFHYVTRSDTDSRSC